MQFLNEAYDPEDRLKAIGKVSDLGFTIQTHEPDQELQFMHHSPGMVQIRAWRKQAHGGKIRMTPQEQEFGDLTQPVPTEIALKYASNRGIEGEAVRLANEFLSWGNYATGHASAARSFLNNREPRD